MADETIPVTVDPGAPAPMQTLADMPAAVADRIFGKEPSEAEVMAAVTGAKPDAAPAKAAEESTDAAGDTPADGEADDGDDTLDTAWKALERDGWSKADLKRMSRDRIVALGTKRAQNHADVDRAFADLKALKAKSAEKPVVESDSSTSDDLSEALAQLDPRLKAALSPLLDKVKALDAIATGYTAQAQAQAVKTVREGLATRGYDAAKSDLVWNAATAAARGLVESEGMDPQAAIDRVFAEMYPSAKPAKPAPEPGRTKNVATPPGQRIAPVARSKAEREFLAFSAIENGDKAAAARIMQT